MQSGSMPRRAVIVEAGTVSLLRAKYVYWLMRSGCLPVVTGVTVAVASCVIEFFLQLTPTTNIAAIRQDRLVVLWLVA